MSEIEPSCTGAGNVLACPVSGGSICCRPLSEGPFDPEGWHWFWIYEAPPLVRGLPVLATDVGVGSSGVVLVVGVVLRDKWWHIGSSERWLGVMTIWQTGGTSRTLLSKFPSDDVGVAGRPASTLEPRCFRRRCRRSCEDVRECCEGCGGDSERPCVGAGIGTKASALLVSSGGLCCPQ